MSRPSSDLRCPSSSDRPPSPRCWPLPTRGQSPGLRRGWSVLCRLSSGFSLIEVLVAVALFAASVTVILALLPGLTRQAVETADRLAAQRLPDAVRVELARLAASDLDSLAAQVPVMSAALSDGLALVATRNGLRVHSRDYQPPVAGLISPEDQYFLVECWRFPDGPLRYDGAQPSLALCVRVSWPASIPAAARHEFIFSTSLNR